ncbi:hypothetical protein F5B20DRAFT_315525 [Whalleya microplaca]|nr:hypothetical protein F5B20DRAFT_315525 [Whalleya microplaca]
MPARMICLYMYLSFQALCGVICVIPRVLRLVVAVTSVVIPSLIDSRDLCCPSKLHAPSLALGSITYLREVSRSDSRLAVLSGYVVQLRVNHRSKPLLHSQPKTGLAYI